MPALTQGAGSTTSTTAGGSSGGGSSVGGFASLFTAAIDRYGQFRSHIARRNMAFINADIAKRNAQLTQLKLDNVKIENKLTLGGIRKEGEAVTSKARALVGISGVQATGAPQRAIEVLVQDQEFRALAVEYAGTVRESELLATKGDFELQEVFSKMEAKAEDRAAMFSDPFAYTKGGTSF